MLWRDLMARKASTFVLIALVAVGVGSLSLMLSIYRDLDGTRAAYYRDYRLAHFSIDLKRAPEAAIRYVETLPGVKEARGRIALPLLLDLEGEEEPISGLALSLPQVRRPVLNDVLLTSGVWFSGQSEREAILNNAFAKANGIRPGDRIKVTLLDEQHDVLVIGLAMSPEFVFLLPRDGGMAPDPERFGVFYMGEEFLQRSGDLEGAYNQILGQAFDSSPQFLAKVLDLTEDVLDPWGVANTTPMQDQPSVSFLASELMGLRSNAVIMPVIFMGVAMLILNVLLTRLIAQQRSTIGTLRALGRSKFETMMHYVWIGLIVSILGAAGGTLLSMGLQGQMIELYKEFFTFPRLEAKFYPEYHAMGLFASLFAGCAGTLRASLRASSLQPAEAMRPPPPEKGRRVLLERIAIFWERLSFRWRLVVRAIFRNPFRSGVNLLTTALAMTLLITVFSLVDSMYYLMDYQFKYIAHEDLTIVLREPTGTRTPKELRDLPIVASVEPQLGVVCDLANGPLRKRLGVIGMQPNNQLFTPLDINGVPVKMPKHGLVLSDKVARMLEVEAGDSITLRPLIGRREKVIAPVVAVVQSYLGLSAYADIDYLSRLIGEHRVANTYLTKTFRLGFLAPLYKELKERPTVVGVSSRLRSITQMQENFEDQMEVGIFVLVGFAGLIAFGSVLNTALVSLGEREREVGTFRVLGYSPREIAAILRGEQVILSIMGTLAGIGGGVAMANLVSAAYDTDLYRFPVVVLPSRIAESFLLMAFFVAVAQFVIYRYIVRLPWLDALKVKE